MVCHLAVIMTYCLINKLSKKEVVGSNIMADDESRTEISNNDIDQEDVTATSISKDIIIHQESINKNDDEDNDSGWLQLSLGNGHDVRSHRPSSENDQRSSVPRLIELDLLTTTGGSVSSSSGGDETWSVTLSASNQQQPNLQPHLDSVLAIAFTNNQRYENNYMPIRPYQLTTLSSPSTSSPSLEQLPLASSRPLSFHHVPQIRTDLRVVDPPRRPHSGIWFILQASQNQTKEPFLPQVPKSYLRIKDGRTTVRLLIKYLVKKLKLHSEYEKGVHDRVGHKLMYVENYVPPSTICLSK